MNLRIPFLFVAFVATTFTAARAQQPTSLEDLQAARNSRVALVVAISRNEIPVARALQQLRAASKSSGFVQSPDVDQAYAALDVGHRLLAVDRPDAAEDFFRVAEQDFDQAAKRTPPGQAREKARYLRELALVRGRFLNKAAQAKADIDEAIRLQPDDKALKDFRGELARGRGEFFKDPQG